MKSSRKRETRPDPSPTNPKLMQQEPLSLERGSWVYSEEMPAVNCPMPA